MKEIVLEVCVSLHLLFASSSFPLVCASTPGEFRKRHFYAFRHLVIKCPVEPALTGPDPVLCSQQPGKATDDEAHQLFTIHQVFLCRFIFSFSSLAQQMLRCACLSEHCVSRMENTEKSGTQAFRSWLISSRTKLSSLQDEYDVTQVMENLRMKMFIPSYVLGTLSFLHFSVPVVLLYSSGLGWRVVTGKAS
jgi:hypothetical protein